MAENKQVVIRRVRVEKWDGLRAASRVLKRSPTQILRHISGACPSKRLQADMERHGIKVEAAV